MKYVALYVILSVFLTLFSYIYKPFVVEANRFIVRNVVFISYPVVNFCESIKDFSDKYLFLVSVKKENSILRKKIIKLELENRLLVRESGKKSSPTLFKEGKIFKAKFKFKNNFNIDYIFLKTDRRLNLKDNSCIVLSNNMNVVGIVEKRSKDFYIAKTIFNNSFVVDSYILSDNSTYRALFIGDLYKPKVEFLDTRAYIKKGSLVYTSGEFGIFPKSLLLGSVVGTSNINNYYKIAYISVDKSFLNDWNVFITCIKKH